ncbi:MAG TPA: TRAP transporter large permease subunit [Gemmatimonadaceae bacterium]|nr:TRAP transporter large permease subunit [Gemmatimonadaceae bacterium]
MSPSTTPTRQPETTFRAGVEAPGGIELPPEIPPFHQQKRLHVEDWALAITLGAMMLLPILEIVLRKTVSRGISNSPALVQHFALIAGMLGAAIAARDGRLLSLGSVEALIKPSWRPVTRFVSRIVAAMVAVLLCYASAEFVRTERASSTVLAYGIPTWVVQLILPIAFALIAWRIVASASKGLKWRAVAVVAVALLIIFAAKPPISREQLVMPAFVVLFIATLLGAPIFTVLAGAGLILFWKDASPLSSLTIDHYGMATNPTVPTIPLFTLAGYFLAEGGASRRLIRVFNAAVGNFRGGPAVLVALVCAFFTSFTGASGVTILALGGLLMPVLMSAGYTEKVSLGLITGTGSLGMLLPPCLPLIFYAVIAGVDIRDMFLGGIGPAIFMILLAAAWGISQAPRRPTSAERKGYDWRELRSAAWEAKWELFLPIVAIGALFSGLATPVEAAALTALYAFVGETFVSRDLKIGKDVPRVMAEAGTLVGGVLIILGVALGLTNYLAFAEVPARAVDWVTGAVHSKVLFLLLVNVFLLIVGMLMDVYSATVIVVPLLIPLGKAFGVDPIHLGIIFLANLELGYLHPPVGQNLFLSSLRFNKSVTQVFWATLPMLVVFLIGVLLITYVPWMTTALPHWLAR